MATPSETSTPSGISAESYIPEPRVSSPDPVTGKYITGGRLDGDIFRLKVGSTQHVFLVHQRILAKSPVLARMTTSGFSESITKEITLPEDDEDTFGRIIEFLYGNLYDALRFNPLASSACAEKLADMFVLADKYDLFDLQETIIEQLEELYLLKENRMAFFNTVYRITQNARDHYGNLRSFFARKVAAHLKCPKPEEIEMLSEMVESDGTFAKWMFEAQMRLYREEQGKWAKESNSMTAKLKHTELDLEDSRESRSKFEAELKKYPTECTVKLQWVHDILAPSDCK